MTKKLTFLLFFTINFVSAQYNWTPLTSIVSNGGGQRFDDVFFLDENLGWAANGAYAAVYKTIDGEKIGRFKPIVRCLVAVIILEILNF